MECACWDGSYSDNYPEFINEKEVKARKVHICGECKRTILPGETYERVSGKWEGTVSTHKTCLDCKSVRDVFFCNWDYGCIWEELKERLEPGECLDKQMLKITQAARERVLEIITPKEIDMLMSCRFRRILYVSGENGQITEKATKWEDGYVVKFTGTELAIVANAVGETYAIPLDVTECMLQLNETPQFISG